MSINGFPLKPDNTTTITNKILPDKKPTLAEHVEIAIDESMVELSKHKKRVALLKQEARAKRESKGLKLNDITTEELQRVIEHWLDGKRGILKHSFEHEFNNATNFEFKEFDWVKGIINAKHFGSELIQVFKISNHPDLVRLRESKVFSPVELKSKKSLSVRIRAMSRLIDLLTEKEELASEKAALAAEKEELAASLSEKAALIERQEKMIEEYKKIDEAKKLPHWREQATLLLDSGMSQTKVAEKLGKGIATIKRLVKAIKEEDKDG